MMMVVMVVVGMMSRGMVRERVEKKMMIHGGTRVTHVEWGSNIVEIIYVVDRRGSGGYTRPGMSKRRHA